MKICFKIRFKGKLLSTSTSIALLSRRKFNMTNVLKPPSTIQGMKVLNKDLIKKSIDVFSLNIKKETLNDILRLIKVYLLKIEKFKAIQNIDEDTVIAYLSPKEIQDWSSFPNDVQSALQKLSVTQDSFKLVKNFELTYDNFSAEDLLKAILPFDKEGMSSFTKLGHIVHVNLREHLLPYKNVIGEILFDKIPGCKSVVNKINIIDSTYRNFEMEILKGDMNMVTTVKENNCHFKFDFSKVYWNSRLCTEHERIIKMLNRNDVLFDVFSGIGPFSIPTAKKKCFVYANDLNPDSFKWLEYNAKSNNIAPEYFKSFNKDGKDFIKDIIKEYLPHHIKNQQKIFITMNLPAMAVEFLSSFECLFNEDELPPLKDDTLVIVYCFVKGENEVELARQLVVNSFNCDIADNIIDIFRVRTVSSFKEMMRITIRLDRDILIGNCRKRKLGDSIVSKPKKICLEDNGQKQEES